MAIEHIKHKGLRLLFERDDPSKLPHDRIEDIGDILQLLDDASEPMDLNLPGLRLHKLEPKKYEIWAVSVNANYRITFKFDDNSDVREVDFLDYH